ncbi:M15 family metallopeptidase [Neobacillus sp. YX16]|uniref:M15 family metallopeptidase n=1 Tax=Neobacillus sp. YX16 TaxID=3047874 RepID=UPI0024C20E82|nr:M15 family metallopeptidase [Neobacillus sp. YX16]WHZ05080.1 M15 family metallopeptidase [Neobacillus sp. YX16]
MKRIKWLLFLIVLGISTILIFKDNETTPSKATGIEQEKVVPLPTELHPIVKERSDQLVQQAAKKGIVVLVTDGFRSTEEQNTIYEQGRTAEGNIVTNAKGGESYHNYGLAIDFALETPSGDVIWDRQYDRNENGKSDWSEVVQIAKSLGFEWGGDWKNFKDYPHLQMDFGLTIADLQDGQRPDELSNVADTQ